MTEEDERVPRVVRRNPTVPAAKLCPNCLSQLKRGSGLGGWLLPQDYYCPKCGYKGYAYLESREDDKEGVPLD